MTFCEALEAAKNGAKIRNKDACWHPNVHLLFNAGRLRVHPDEPYNVWASDLSADWEVVSEPPKPMPFEEALVHYKAGKTIKRLAWCKDDTAFDVRSDLSKEAVLATDWVVVE